MFQEINGEFIPVSESRQIARLRHTQFYQRHGLSFDLESLRLDQQEIIPWVVQPHRAKTALMKIKNSDGEL